MDCERLLRKGFSVFIWSRVISLNDSCWLLFCHNVRHTFEVSIKLAVVERIVSLLGWVGWMNNCCGGTIVSCHWY